MGSFTHLHPYASGDTWCQDARKSQNTSAHSLAHLKLLLLRERFPSQG